MRSEEEDNKCRREATTQIRSLLMEIARIYDNARYPEKEDSDEVYLSLSVHKESTDENLHIRFNNAYWDDGNDSHYAVHYYAEISRSKEVKNG